MAVLVTLNDAEYALLRDHLGAVGAWCRLALIGRDFINAFVLRSASAKRSNDVWHAPDAILVGDKNVIISPSESIRSVQVLNVAVDPCGVSAAVIPQKGQVSCALFSDQNVAVGQDEKTSGIDETSRKRCRCEPRRHLRHLSVIRHSQRAIGDNRAGLRRWQLGSVDAKPTAYLVLGQKILGKPILAAWCLPARIILLCVGEPDRRDN